MTDLQARTKTNFDRADLSAQTLDFDAIPVLDITELGHPDVERRLAVALKIREACERVGFFYVTNHGIPLDLIDKVFGAAEAFFALPAEEKLKVDIRKSDRHRGYCATGVLSSDINNPNGLDLQEAYEVSVEIPADDPDYLAGNPMYGPNLWPEHPTAFRTEISAYLDELIRLGRLLFGGFALALGLEETWFEDKITKPMGQLRVIHYPPQKGPIDPGRIGIGAHTDYECFTILAQTAAGLQVQNAGGHWVSAPPIPGTLVINIGDCMQRWTNDLFKSTLHRVINLSGVERYSLAFFYGADYHAVVDCLPTCQSADNPAKYPPVRAGEWTVRNIQAAYTYKPNLV